MTHHVAPAPFLRRAGFLAAALALAALPGCSSSSDDGGGVTDPVTTGLRLIVTAAVPVSGVQADIRHDSRLTVLTITEGAVFAGATCAENVTNGRLQLGCVSVSAAATPVLAWTIGVQHSAQVDPESAVTSVTCTAADALGNPIAATCAFE